MAAAEEKLQTIENRIQFRSNIEDLVVIARAVCRPGQSVEDLVGVLNLSTSNDMMLELLMEKVETAKMEEQTNLVNVKK